MRRTYKSESQAEPEDWRIGEAGDELGDMLERLAELQKKTRMEYRRGDGR